jgi:hypothetical protein
MRLLQLMLPAGWVVLLFAACESVAIDRLILEAAEVSGPGVNLSKAVVTLDLATRGGPQLRARAASANVSGVSENLGAYRDVEIRCPEIVVKEPRFACRGANISALGGPMGSVSLRAAAELNTARGLLTVDGADLAMAGGFASGHGTIGTLGWSLSAQGDGFDVSALRELLAPWYSLPEAYTASGRLSVTVDASRRGEKMSAELSGRAADINFSNEEGTVVAENVAAEVDAVVTHTENGSSLNVRLHSAAGQALAGPVLLDFGANPLQVSARGGLTERTLALESFSVAQKNLLTARGQGRVLLNERPIVAQARVSLDNLEFPAAYTSFLQLPLATTDFAALRTSGRVSGAIEIAENKPQRIDARFDALDIGSPQDKFSMADLRGEVHWAASEDAEVPPSYLSWSRGSAYGLSGGRARIDFRSSGFGFDLIRPARLPVFDGAVVVSSLAARRLGQPKAELNFDAVIEPISMPKLSKAFGWPELQGELAGRIPGLTYRNGLLAVDGDLSARVFDGIIVGRNFRLRDPLGPWPRLYADVTARSLDLELVTRAFSIGSITGRIDADVKGLELFNWSPVGFDARLYSTPGDRSRRLISQKAVTSISNVGGGGGAVTTALQSGVLRFFDVFRYDEIGLTCQLRSDVCFMSGIEPAGNGYYIVKGKGLPRIDIIGNQGRVDWPQLVSQIVAGMRSESVIVR